MHSAFDNCETFGELEMLPDAQEKATTLGDATDGSDSPPPQDGGETPAA